MNGLPGALLLGLFAVGAAASNEPFETGSASRPERIWADYHQVRAELRNVGRGHVRATPDILRLLDQAWPLIGEWAAAYVRRHADASGEAVAAAIECLNRDDEQQRPEDVLDTGCAGPVAPPGGMTWSTPDMMRSPGAVFGMFGEPNEIDDFFANLESYRVTAQTLALTATGAPAQAVALSYSNWGRLLVVSTATPVASAPIDRGGMLHHLPESEPGRERFYVDARSDDWPTSFCRGGQLTIWEWDGERLRRLLLRGYSDRGPEPGWGIELGHRKMKVHTKGTFQTFGECCACTELRAVRRIRITPNTVEDEGLRYQAPEFPFVDRVLYRVLRGKSIEALATPAVARDLNTILSKVCRVDEHSFYLGMLGRWRVSRDAEATVLEMPLGEQLNFQFRIVKRNGHSYVAAMPAPDPKLQPFLATLDAKMKQRGLNRLEIPDRRTAAAMVAAERPEVVPDEPGVRAVVENPFQLGCEAGEWPWPTRRSRAGRP